MTKEECENALNSLRIFSLQNLNADLRVVTKSNQVIETLIKEHFNDNGNVRAIANIVIDEDKMKEMINDGINNILNPIPYKFEDLKEDEPLWDYKCDCWRFNMQTDNCKKGFYDVVADEWVDFEENRFFPITKALQKEVKDDE